MPIVFEQPGAISPAASMGGGAADQFSRDFPSLVSQQRTQAEMYMKQAQLQQQAREANANRGQQAVQFQLSREPSQRDYFQQSAAMDQATHHANLQMQLSQTQLSQQENMHLQRMKNAIGAVNANPNLSDAEKADMITTLQSGIKPYEARLAASAEQSQRLQQRRMEQQIAEQDRLDDERTAYQTQGAQQHVETVTNPATGQRYIFMRHEDGKRTFLGVHGGSAAVWEGGGGTSNTAGPGAAPGEPAEHGGSGRGGPNHTAIMAQARANVAAAAGRDAAGHPIPVSTEAINAEYTKLLNQMHPPQTGVNSDQLRQQIWREVRSQEPNASLDEAHRKADAILHQRMLQVPIDRANRARVQATEEIHRGTAGRPEVLSEEIENRLRQRLGSAYREPDARTRILQGYQPASRATAAANLGLNQSNTVQGPFNLFNPQNAQETAIARQFSTARAALSASPVQGEARTAIERAIDENMRLVQRRGHVSNMTAEERRDYLANRQTIDAMPNPPLVRPVDRRSDTTRVLQGTSRGLAGQPMQTSTPWAPGLGEQ